MLVKVADLFVEVSEEGGIAPLLEKYRTAEKRKADVVIDASRYRAQSRESLSPFNCAYVESSAQFSYWLPRFSGMMLHASAVELDGRAYLFSGPCGIGKSTHTRLWKEEFPSSVVFNDDKPALRLIDGRWFAYGTPWSGKDHVNANVKASLAGICFLKRGGENSIRTLSVKEALPRLIHQTMRVFKEENELDLMLRAVASLAQNIPIYELSALPNAQAARLTHDTMLLGAKEAGL